MAKLSTFQILWHDRHGHGKKNLEFVLATLRMKAMFICQSDLANAVQLTFIQQEYMAIYFTSVCLDFKKNIECFATKKQFQH